jgi:hypothetical protein
LKSESFSLKIQSSVAGSCYLYRTFQFSGLGSAHYIVGKTCPISEIARHHMGRTVHFEEPRNNSLQLSLRRSRCTCTQQHGEIKSCPHLRTLQGPAERPLARHEDSIVQFYVSLMAGAALGTQLLLVHARRRGLPPPDEPIQTVLFRRWPSPRTLQTLSRSRRSEQVSEPTGAAAFGRERHRVSQAC